VKKLIIFLLLVFLVGCKASFEDEYPMFKDQEHIYQIANYDEVISAFTVEEGAHLILFAFKECPYCQLTMPLINEAALELGFEKILYFDIKSMRSNNTAEYQLLLGYLDSKVGDLDIRDGEIRLTVPDLYVVKDGKILSHHIATFKRDGSYVLDLVEAEIEELLHLYKEMMQEAI
jgi:thiol-disulfide isomerase/thioredoxin